MWFHYTETKIILLPDGQTTHSHTAARVPLNPNTTFPACGTRPGASPTSKPAHQHVVFTAAHYRADAVKVEHHRSVNITIQVICESFHLV